MTPVHLLFVFGLHHFVVSNGGPQCCHFCCINFQAFLIVGVCLMKLTILNLQLLKAMEKLSKIHSNEYQ